jgi:Fe-S-cluster containining protein
MRRSSREEITSKTCLSCGACCVAPEDTESFCDVTATDAERLGKRFVRLHVLQPRPIDSFLSVLRDREERGAIRTRWRKQTRGPHRSFKLLTCSMLSGNVMHKVKCRIYAKRPEVCHKAVVPGDTACREIRRAFHASIEQAETA